MAEVIGDTAVTDEQEAWLGLIQAHLAQNLNIDRHDFDELPALSRKGGWGRANRVFAGDLDKWLQNLNRAVATVRG